MKNQKIFFFFSIFVLFGYFIYGIFYADIPPVRADDLWEISRAHFLLKYHHQGDPMYPMEISPYMASLFNATVGSQYFGIIKTGSQAFFIALLPIDDIYAFRITSFVWSLLVCFLTYKVAIKIGLNKRTAFFSCVMLIIIPDFFGQLHTQRPELMVSASYLAGMLLFIYTLELENSLKKKLLIFFCGIYGWLMVVYIHPNAIMIPVTFGCLYLLREYKNIFSINTLLISLSLLAGLIYFYHIMHSAAAQASLEGGSDILDVTGPPILRRGIKALITLPLVFYNKFSSPNIFARPGSLLFFLSSCISFYYLLKKKKISVYYGYLDIVISAIIVPIITLHLFSASNGHYNIIVFPLCTVIIAAAINEFNNSSFEKSNFVYMVAGMMFLIFLSNFIGLKKNIEYAKEFQHIRREIRKTISDSTSTIIGSSLYYLDFKDQHYYSNSGMNPRIGRTNQSFEQAVSSVHTKYLIIDDGLVYQLMRGRGKEWTDSMFLYLDKKCELISQINSNYWFGHTGGINAYPLQWRYEGQNEEFLRKIKIYRIDKS